MLGPSLHRVVAFTLLAASFYTSAFQDAGTSLDTDALLALPACGVSEKPVACQHHLIVA